MRVVLEASYQVVDEGLERVGPRPRPDARSACPGETGPDRLAVTDRGRRAIAEIVQPRWRSACASTSSPCVSMRSGTPFGLEAWSLPASEGSHFRGRMVQGECHLSLAGCQRLPDRLACIIQHDPCRRKVGRKTERAVDETRIAPRETTGTPANRRVSA